MTQIIDFGIDELFVRMTECFSSSIFDVFPCDALPAAETLKIRVIRTIRENPRFRPSPPQSQSHRRLSRIRRIPVYQSYFPERKRPYQNQFV